MCLLEFAWLDVIMKWVIKNIAAAYVQLDRSGGFSDLNLLGQVLHI
jgi:hypothetical protein